MNSRDCFTRFSTLFGIKKNSTWANRQKRFCPIFFLAKIFPKNVCSRSRWLSAVDWLCRVGLLTHGCYLGRMGGADCGKLGGWLSIMGVLVLSWPHGWLWLCWIGLLYYSNLGVILVSWVVVIMLSIIGLILATWISFGWLTQLWVLSWNNESFLDFMGGGDYTGLAYSVMKVILA